MTRAQTADAVGRAALDWLSILDDGQRRVARLPFDSSRRPDWHYIPRQRAGLPLGGQSEAQRRALFDLLGAVCSDQGLAKINGVIRLEGILGELTGDPAFRDPGNYALAVFGEPGNGEPWTFRFEGHHLSLTFTIVPGAGIAVTPHFLGANPAVVPHGHAHAGDELLAPERELGFALIRGLEPEQRKRAIIDWTIPSDVAFGPGNERLARRQGLPLGAMNEARREAAMALIAEYARNLRHELAEKELAAIREGGLEEIHFGWIGTLEPNAPYYFRLHGPTVVLEYDNTRGGNHIHSVWHDPRNVFGEDLLAQHYHESVH